MLYYPCLVLLPFCTHVIILVDIAAGGGNVSEPKETLSWNMFSWKTQICETLCGYEPMLCPVKQGGNENIPSFLAADSSWLFQHTRVHKENWLLHDFAWLTSAFLCLGHVWQPNVYSQYWPNNRITWKLFFHVFFKTCDVFFHKILFVSFSTTTLFLYQRMENMFKRRRHIIN